MGTGTPGRPPKPEDAKLKRVQILLSPRQIEALQRLCLDEGRPMSMLVRDLVAERLKQARR